MFFHHDSYLLSILVAASLTFWAAQIVLFDKLLLCTGSHFFLSESLFCLRFPV